MHDRRVDARIHRPLEALCRAQKSTFHRARVCDLSERGARLVIQDEAPRGSRLSLNLKLGPSGLTPVEAQVMWSKPSRQRGETEVGVRLRGATPTALRSIEIWLRRHTAVAV